jgi:hypothetical protein
MTVEELKYRQGWTLEQKIDHAVGTVEFFLSQTGGKGYVSFSGEKTVRCFWILSVVSWTRTLQPYFTIRATNFPKY